MVCNPTARSPASLQVVKSLTDIQLCHLLEAQADISSPGIYDLDQEVKGSLKDKEKALRTAIAYDFNLHKIPLYAEDEQSQALLPPKDKRRKDDWIYRLCDKGLGVNDIQFLFQILNPVPNERWTAGEIAGCGYLDTDRPRLSMLQRLLSTMTSFIPRSK
jgi:hypothetical protein